MASSTFQSHESKASFFSLFLCIFIFLGSFVTTFNALESDRIINLPGQPLSPPISHFSGYITVNQAHGRALFYWFFEAQSQPSNMPLLLWLNGGPGCSSIGYGAAVELGPLRVNKNGVGLDFNKNSWNKEANLLFVESPVGVGFSYTNTSSDLTELDDGFVAEDAYNFLVNWLKRFPQFKTHDFFISGESYAGHYVPQLAELVYDRNKDRAKYPYINLKGFIVGSSVLKRVRIPGGYEPCFSAYAEKYFNKVDVQTSLHANTRGANSSVEWKVCNDSLLYKFTVFSVLPIYTKLIKGGLRIWIYSGDTDGRVPVIGSRYCIEALGLPLKTPWHSWYHNHQVGGRTVEYEGLRYVTVRGAGHLVPFNKPSEALSIIHSFLSGQDLPKDR
ncbi:serine carboxypeptidase-like 33 isoform X2 [Cornus florida]|uniref:serine carboxypeptidase-like 33 isoform X2 n=1 Tax=Cornus florida TaxID=4283 RepID=UPI00289AF3D4|nr:serine carboxypeptidase-like 33 isoform X2 [Cornus florida]